MINMMQDMIRPLNKHEVRLLKDNIQLLQHNLNSLFRRIMASSFFIAIILVLLIFLTAHPSGFILGCMFVIYMGIGFWSYLGEKRKILKNIHRYQNALDKNEAREIHIKSNRMVEFDESEDEGACYAFQLDDDRIIFVEGQDFYPLSKFPNDDFSIIEIRDSENSLLETAINNYGKKIKPLRKIPAKQKSEIRIPEHLRIIDGKLEDIEKSLLKRE